MEKLFKIAEKFLKENNIPLGVEKSDYFDYGLANYDPNLKIIYLSLEAIIDKAQQWKVDPKNYLILVMSHEIGHFYDEKANEISEKVNELFKIVNSGKSYNELEREIIKLVKKREVNAWEIGKKLVPINLERDYEILNRLNLEYRFYNTKIKLMELKHNNETIKLTEKLLKQSQEIKELTEKNIKLMEENFNLKFNKDDLTI